MINTLSGKGSVTPELAAGIARLTGSSLFIYDGRRIRENCDAVLAMPNPFGLHVSYAMKANYRPAIIQLVTGRGLGIDASSIYEAMWARDQGKVPLSRIQLTSQHIPTGDERRTLEQMMIGGMKYTVCSLRQLQLVAPFASANKIKLAMRVHPGNGGSGETHAQETGSPYSCFGVHQSDLEEALRISAEHSLTYDEVHMHIGSGGEPEKWKKHVDTQLEIMQKYFPDATTINLGGGFKVGRMPQERSADLQDLGEYASSRIQQFARQTGRELQMKVEPGTYIIADAGYLVTEVIDVKSTGPDGYKFAILGIGMNANTRPLLYGSEHPFYVMTRDGRLLSREGDPAERAYHVVGPCCESGDAQTLAPDGKIRPRAMANPQVGGFFCIGAVGAYDSSMDLEWYNLFPPPPEFMYDDEVGIYLIREGGTFEELKGKEHDMILPYNPNKR